MAKKKKTKKKSEKKSQESKDKLSIQELDEDHSQAPTQTDNGAFVYGDLLPHEIPVLKPYLVDLFKSVGFTEGAENPEPELKEMVSICNSSYGKVHCCFHKGEIAGYIYFAVDRNKFGEVAAYAKQIYVRPEYRQKVSIFKNLIGYGLNVASRSGAKYIQNEVRTRKMAKFWQRRGFRVNHQVMIYDGTPKEFLQENGFDTEMKEVKDAGRLVAKSRT